MRTFCRRRHPSRPCVARRAAAVPASGWEFLVGIALLPVGALLLIPLVASAQDTAADSVLSAEEIESLHEQLDAADTTESDLWEEYQQYRDRDDLHASGERVKVGDSVEVDASERIRGSVVSIGGRTIVSGHVEGDAVAIGGDVILRSGAVVEGDAVSVGGRVRRESGVRVMGEQVSVTIPSPFSFSHDFDYDDYNDWSFGAISMGFTLGYLLIGLLLTYLLYAIASHRLDVVSRRVDAEPGQSFLVGILGSLGAPVAMILATVLLTITIIGLLLVPVLLFVWWLLGFAGFAAVALAVGRRLGHLRDGAASLGRSRSPYFYILLGFLALHGFWILSSVFDLFGSALGVLSLICSILGAIVLTFANTLGFGAVLLCRFGTQLPGGGPAFVPASSAASSAASSTGPPTPPPPPPPGEAADDASPAGEAPADSAPDESPDEGPDEEPPEAPPPTDADEPRK